MESRKNDGMSEKSVPVRTCKACGATVQCTSYVPAVPRHGQVGYWTGYCCCGCNDALQVVDGDGTGTHTVHARKPRR